MNEVINFIENYYNDNLTFDQNEFLKIIDVLINTLSRYKNSTSINSVLVKIMNRYQNQDFYEVMQIIEYELIQILEEQ